MSHTRKTTHSVPVFEIAKGVIAKVSQQLVDHTAIDWQYVSVGAQAPVNLNSTAQFQQKVPRTLDNWKKLLLEFTITNADDAAATYMPYYFILDYINLKFGAASVGPFYADMFYQHYVMFNDVNQMTVNQAATNISPSTFTSVGALGAGASATVRIDLSMMIDSFHGIIPDGFKDDILIEVFTKPSSYFKSAGDANVTCNNFAFYFGHELLEDEEKRIRVHHHRSSNFVYKFLMPIQYKGNFTCTAGVTYNDTIKQINGYTSQMFITLRPQNPTGTGLIGFVSLTNLYLKDDSTRIIGDNQWTGSFIKHIATDHFPNNSALNTLNIYPMTFSKSPAFSAHTGNTSGGFTFTGNSESVYFVPAAGSSTANELNVLAYIYHRLISENGIARWERQL